MIAEQEAGGVLIRAFCKQRGVSDHSFYCWRSWLRQKEPVQLETPPLSRTTASTFLHDGNSDYDNAYIRNRPLVTTMTPAGGSAITMSTNTYDIYTQGLIVDTGYMMVQHDSNVGTSVTKRGNVTTSVTPNGTTDGNKTKAATISKATS